MKYYTIRFSYIKNGQERYESINIVAKNFGKVLEFINIHKFKEDYYKVENIDFVNVVDDIFIAE